MLAVLDIEEDQRYGTHNSIRCLFGNWRVIVSVYIVVSVASNT